MSMSKLMIVGMVLFLAGCATAGDRGGAVAPAVDVTGTWNGSFTNVGSTGNNFSFVAVLEPKGNIVTGTMSGGLASYNGPIQGTVSGNTFSWRQLMGSASGTVTVSGHEMNGTGTATAAAYTGRLNLRRAQ